MVMAIVDAMTNNIHLIVKRPITGIVIVATNMTISMLLSHTAMLDITVVMIIIENTINT